MQDYTNCTCPVCKKKFSAGDDIVVCPDCGAPYHRDCYVRVGSCIYADQHADGFTWHAPVSVSAESPRCPKCGASCPADAVFCPSCGTPLKTAGIPVVSPAAQRQELGTAAGTADRSGYEDPGADLRGEIDGIPVSDFAAFIGRSSPYYIYRFRQMDKTGRKGSFSFSAALFPYFYFFYRKMWGLGAIALALNILLGLPATVLTLFDYGYLAKLPLLSYATYDTLSTVLSFVLLFIQFGFFGLFGTYLYRRHCVRCIQKFRSYAQNDSEYRWYLENKGGPSRAVLFTIVGFYLVLLILISLPV